jgi:hypothetical protein
MAMHERKNVLLSQERELTTYIGREVNGVGYFVKGKKKEVRTMLFCQGGRTPNIHFCPQTPSHLLSHASLI